MGSRKERVSESTSSEAETETETESSAMEGEKEESLKWLEDLPDVPMGKLPPQLEFQRTRVECKPDAPIHVLYFASSL